MERIVRGVHERSRCEGDALVGAAERDASAHKPGRLRPWPRRDLNVIAAVERTLQSRSGLVGRWCLGGLVPLKQARRVQNTLGAAGIRAASWRQHGGRRIGSEDVVVCFHGGRQRPAHNPHPGPRPIARGVLKGVHRHERRPIGAGARAL